VGEITTKEDVMLFVGIVVLLLDDAGDTVIAGAENIAGSDKSAVFLEGNPRISLRIGVCFGNGEFTIIGIQNNVVQRILAVIRFGSAFHGGNNRFGAIGKNINVRIAGIALLFRYTVLGFTTKGVGDTLTIKRKRSRAFVGYRELVQNYKWGNYYLPLPFEMKVFLQNLYFVGLRSV
jgi:hypothetical protein